MILYSAVNTRGKYFCIQTESTVRLHVGRYNNPTKSTTQTMPAAAPNTAVLALAGPFCWLLQFAD